MLAGGKRLSPTEPTGETGGLRSNSDEVLYKKLSFIKGLQQNGIHFATVPLGWTKNSVDWTNRADNAYTQALSGYPKAYSGTSSGEVCSKHKAFLCLVWCTHFATAPSACFRRARPLPYPHTPTSSCSTNLPSFFDVCQRVDRFIDTLKWLSIWRAIFVFLIQQSYVLKV